MIFPVNQFRAVSRGSALHRSCRIAVPAKRASSVSCGGTLVIAFGIMVYRRSSVFKLTTGKEARREVSDVYLNAVDKGSFIVFT